MSLDPETQATSEQKLFNKTLDNEQLLCYYNYRKRGNNYE